MGEFWYDVANYEGYYQVSNFGSVRSFDRYVPNAWGNGLRLMKGKILKAGKDGNGYKQVNLYIDKNSKMVYIHRLVAETFLPNPNNYPYVNHKDEDKTNNFVWVNPDGSIDPEKSNLEWCSAKYNVNYGTRNKRAGKKLTEFFKENGGPFTGRKHTEESKQKMSKSSIKYSKEELAEHRKEYRLRNREKILAYQREWYKKYGRKK